VVGRTCPGPKCSEPNLCQGQSFFGPNLCQGQSCFGPKCFQAEVGIVLKYSSSRSIVWAKVSLGPICNKMICVLISKAKVTPRGMSMDPRVGSLVYMSIFTVHKMIFWTLNSFKLLRYILTHLKKKKVLHV
jgi:hypothetical protein